MLHPVIGCLKLPVATGQAMFEIEDALPGAQPGVRLFGVKGLGDKVVRTGFHARDDSFLVRASCQENGVHITVMIVMSNAAHQLQTVYSWHHPVTDNDREGFVLKSSPSLISIWCGEHLMAPSLERLAEHSARYGIVFGY